MNAGHEQKQQNKIFRVTSAFHRDLATPNTVNSATLESSDVISKSNMPNADVNITTRNPIPIHGILITQSETNNQ